MVKMKLCFTCPICGRMAFVEQLDRRHKFPRIVWKKFVGAGKIEHEEVHIEDVRELVTDKIVKKCIEILERAGYEVKLVKKK